MEGWVEGFWWTLKNHDDEIMNLTLFWNVNCEHTNLQSNKYVVRKKCHNLQEPQTKRKIGDFEKKRRTNIFVNHLSWFLPKIWYFEVFTINFKIVHEPSKLIAHNNLCIPYGIHDVGGAERRPLRRRSRFAFFFGGSGDTARRLPVEHLEADEEKGGAQDAAQKGRPNHAEVPALQRDWGKQKCYFCIFATIVFFRLREHENLAKFSKECTPAVDVQ